MATPSVTSTKESTNYARLCRLLIDVGSRALRDLFDGFYSPGNLHAFFSSSSVQPKLKSLKRKKILNSTQWSKLFPADPTKNVSSASFDTTLLNVLLRNICGLSPPASTTSWDKVPPPRDTCREADLVRVKDFRNTVYAHVEKASVDDAFERLWHDIGSAIVRLRPDYADAIEQLRTTCMDPEMEERNALLKRMILSGKSFAPNNSTDVFISMIVMLMTDLNVACVAGV